MRMWINSLAALVSLVAVGLTMAQPPAGGGALPAKPQPAPAKPVPNSLEAMIAAALKHNPDITHAEAKVAEANAALNSARLKVMQSVATAQGSLEGARATLKLTELLLEKQKSLSRMGAGVISKLEIDKAELEVQRAKAEVTTLEAQLAILQGKGPGQKDLSGVSFTPDSTRLYPLIGAAAFDPEGKRLYIPSADGSVRIWDAASGRQVV